MDQRNHTVKPSSSVTKACPFPPHPLKERSPKYSSSHTLAEKLKLRWIPRLRVEQAIGLTMLIVGCLLIVGGWFVLNLWIPAPGNIWWTSMDSWKQIMLVQDMTGSYLLGAGLILVGGILFKIQPTHLFVLEGLIRDVKTLGRLSTGMKAWLLLQLGGAVAIISWAFREWYQSNILGAPMYFDKMPLNYPLAVVLVEGSALGLIFLTWRRTRSEFLFGWVLLSVLRFVLSYQIGLIPWIYPGSPLPFDVGLGPGRLTIVQPAEAVFALISIVVLYSMKDAFREARMLFGTN
jgi:hypothetical protein